MRAVRTVAVAAVLCVAAAGCGDSSDDGGSDSGGEGSADQVSAVLGIITTNIDTDTGDGFSDAVEGEELTVGDRVKTDSTGFAEVTYHDGSWMRVESEATLTIEDLADGESGQVVSTSIDTGEAWSRVRELSEPEEEFSVETPVASAAVRGTAFAIDCEGDTACTFSVVEGEVLITPDVGDPVTLTAGQSLTVTAGEEPPAPEEPGVEALSQEPFIAENLELDETKAAETEGGDGGGDEEGAVGLEDLEGEWTATPSDVRLGAVTGRFTAITPQLSLAGDRVAYSWATAETGPLGDPAQSGSGEFPLTAGTYDFGCDAESCMGIGAGFPLVVVADGSGAQLGTLEGGPREAGCGLAPPAGAWQIERVDDDTLRYTDVVSQGSGGADGCANAFTVEYVVTLTRAG